MTKMLLIAGAGAAAAAAALGALCALRRRRPQPRKVLQGSKDKVKLPLLRVEDLNHNSKLFVFRFDCPEMVLGLPVGQHVSLQTHIDGKLVSRAYTPVSGDEVPGEIRLAVKIYPNGKMTQHLAHMAVGQTLTFSGPKGEFEYLGRGRCRIVKRKVAAERKHKAIGMIAGGSGLTPVLQVARAVFADPADKTQVFLLYANEKEADIWYREELEAMQRERPGQFHVWFVLSKPSPEWDQGRGYITTEMMRERLGPNELVLMCGPPPMVKAMEMNLAELNVAPTNQFKF